MRILSRPMFKYGGPIKEGVMHGMKNGGSMGNHEGPRRAALVGNPVFPKDSSGRAHHVWPYYLGAGIYAGARAALPWAARMGARILPKVKRMFGTTTSAKHMPVREITGMRGQLYKTPFKQGKKFIKAGDEVTTSTFNPNWLGRDPLVQSIGWAGKTLTSPTAKGIGAKALRFATAPSTVVGGLWFANGRWFNKKGEELDPDGAEVANAKTKAGGPPGGGSGMRGTGEWFEAEAQKKLAEKNKADRKAKIAKYMDTMGYDRAQKNALGKALVDASAIVQAGTEEGGSLKHADWSKMINQAIQATSKRLEKPEQIREAVGLMMTKAGIEKDMTAEADAQARRKLNLQIEKLGMEINPSAADLALSMDDKADKQITLENIVKKVEGIENLKASFKDVKDTTYGDWKKKKENKNKSSLDFMEKIIKPSGVMVPGFYVFPTKIVEVTDDLTIKWYQ